MYQPTTFYNDAYPMFPIQTSDRIGVMMLIYDLAKNSKYNYSDVDYGAAITEYKDWTIKYLLSPYALDNSYVLGMANAFTTEANLFTKPYMDFQQISAFYKQNDNYIYNLSSSYEYKSYLTLLISGGTVPIILDIQ